MPQEYSYTRLHHLADEFWRQKTSNNRYAKVHIYARIKDILSADQATLSVPNGEEVVTILLMDDQPSVTPPVRCEIVDADEGNLREHLRVGDVIRIHRIAVRMLTSEDLLLFGKVGVAGLAIVVFSGVQGDPYDVIYSSTRTHTLEEGYEDKVEELRLLGEVDVQNDDDHAPDVDAVKLDGDEISLSHVFVEKPPMDVVGDEDCAQGNAVDADVPLPNCEDVTDESVDEESPSDTLPSNFKSLQDFTSHAYYDVVVQVVSIFISDRDNVVLRCWDTTKFRRSSLFSFGKDETKSVVASDATLMAVSEGLTCDFIMYGEHGKRSVEIIQPGDVVVMRNVHYYVKQDCSSLVMHDGVTSRKYNRGIDVLNDESPLKAVFLRRLRRFRDTNNRVEENEPCSAPETEETRPNAVSSNEQIRRICVIHGFLMRQVVNALCWESVISLRSKSSVSYSLLTDRIFYFIRFALKQIYTSSRPGSVFRALSHRSDSGLEELFITCFLRYAAALEGLRLKIRTGEESCFEDDVEVGEPPRKKSKAEVLWTLTLVKGVPFGTVMNVNGWTAALSFTKEQPIFVFQCAVCGYWSRIPVSQIKKPRLCVACFEDNKMSPLSINCYFAFRLLWDTEEPVGGAVFLLFSLVLMKTAYGFKMPDTPLLAAKAWENGVNTDDMQSIFDHAQEVMSRYKFNLVKVKMRHGDQWGCVFEVLKLKNSYSF